MERVPNGRDLIVDVEGIGRFHFARRQMRDTYRIRGVYNRLTDGNYTAEGDFADLSALAYATIDVLMTLGPDDFELDALDPLVDEQCDEKLMKIFMALREKELSFRPGSGTKGQEQGQGARQ